ncbi:hypothetical protein PAXRUDRAFT_119397, partial [Paxillus rubicundulus Ve08.2h10]
PVLMTFPIMSSRIAMTAGSQVNCEPLLIIHFYCKGMDLQGLPLQAIVNYLRPYFQPGDLQFLQSEFDFATHAKINIHREKIHMVIFISMHSNEERGDLFAGQEGPEMKPRPIAVNMDCISPQSLLTNDTDICLQFFSLLFQSSMDRFLDGATLVLLTCGWLVK